MFGNSQIDVEKEAVRVGSVGDGAIPGDTFEYGNSMYARIQRLAGKFNVEQRGIERVPEDERDDTSLLNVGTMWLSANMVISSFAIGLLAQKLFFLGFVDAILTCLFFNMLGVLSTCYFSTFGPRFGLRQMVLSRYWFGRWGVKLIAVFNVLACIGWSSVNSIVGAQLLHAVNNDVPGWAGIMVISVGTLFVTFFGYKIVHAYEFWSWIPTFIVFLIVLGEFAHSGAFVNLPMGVGTSELGGVLSFGSVVYGFATGWTSYAADYTVYQPVTQSRKKVFGAVWIGLMIPLLFTEFLGIAIMTATTINDGNNRYMDGYNASGTGGLLAAVLFPPLGGFGKFCLVVLALSIIANNCPNVYSVALTMQVMGRWTQHIPRFIWTTIGTVVYIAIAIPGYSHFEEVLENFMNFIGYWLAIYEGIAFAEHFLYRRSMDAYDASTYDQPSKLPPSIAAVFAFCCGVAGMVTGMSQTWFVGPIALHAGEAPFGGDVGFELGFAFAFVSYAVARYFERKFFGR
ncbi:purine-cytosine permease [Bimuria novae-zelandiae CBS 107.79]|uniref:Purine-cytosine permease n=1 Tax=Bimuria novae-zelandiae CBS 107.79 TaxID=1447943 RepID=A0A6A5VNV3_9PLEO|nr:purine-cytosine permease [Bimuria novae-zelandiae CBS 107.79]